MATLTAKERTRLEDAFGAWELKTDPDSEEHGFVEHQDIPQLIRALGYALSNEELGMKLADANIGETMEYDEYLLLVKQLGKRADKSVEVRELKGAIAMVTKDKEYINIDDIARVMGVIGESTGEALNLDELDDFKQQLGSEEMKIDDFVAMLIDV